jgi:hypothetical protein
LFQIPVKVENTTGQKKSDIQKTNKGEKREKIDLPQNLAEFIQRHAPRNVQPDRFHLDGRL